MNTNLIRFVCSGENSNLFKTTLEKLQNNLVLDGCKISRKLKRAIKKNSHHCNDAFRQCKNYYIRVKKKDTRKIKITTRTF